MYTVRQLVETLGDRVLKVSGALGTGVAGFAPALPGYADHMSFISGPSERVAQVVNSSRSEAFLIPAGSEVASAERRPLVTVTNPRLAFAIIARALYPDEEITHLSGIHESSCIGPRTSVGSGVVIGPDVVIGAECVIGPNVVINRRCQIGARVVIGPGSVIGGVGFGFERDEDGVPVRLPHYGGVTIGDDVEIGANAIIDRGVFVDTFIGDHAKIDGLVLVGHNARVGRGAYVIGGSVLCGSVDVGSNAWIAPGSTVMEKIQVGDDATVGIGATVCRDVPSGETVVSLPARPSWRPGEAIRR